MEDRVNKRLPLFSAFYRTKRPPKGITLFPRKRPFSLTQRPRCSQWKLRARQSSRALLRPHHDLFPGILCLHPTPSSLSAATHHITSHSRPPLYINNTVVTYHQSEDDLSDSLDWTVVELEEEDALVQVADADAVAASAQDAATSRL